ncbi:MAG: hypothetical protein AB1898_09675 [Acidobacteriota bacterium]
MPMSEGTAARQKSQSANLTRELWLQLREIHTNPRLRRGLPKATAEVPKRERELAYLLCALEALELGRPNLSSCRRYLTACDHFGIPLWDFLRNGAALWSVLREGHREHSRLIASSLMTALYPKLPAETAAQTALEMLSLDLARVAPALPGIPGRDTQPLLLLRAQPSLRWTVAQVAEDCGPSLETHFPEIEWAAGSCSTRRISFVGIRLMSALIQRTGRTLTEVFAGLRYLATTRVAGHMKLICVALFRQSDRAVLEFNLRHFSKRAGLFYEVVPADRQAYRLGYPGFSGFFEDEELLRLGLPTGSRERPDLPDVSAS